MKEILDAIDSRIKSPIFGYFIASLLAVNWQSFFYLIADDSSADIRILYFNNNTDIYSIIFYPAIIAVAYSIIYPWINYLFMFLCTKPTELKNALQAQSEHELLIKKKELEEARSKLLSNTENELIERAKRDAELDEIKDDEAREKLKSEIDHLRQERDDLRSSTKTKPDYDEYKKLMDLADDQRKRATNTNDFDDKKLFTAQARDFESRAHMLIKKKMDG